MGLIADDAGEDVGSRLDNTSFCYQAYFRGMLWGCEMYAVLDPV